MYSRTRSSLPKLLALILAFVFVACAAEIARKKEVTEVKPAPKPGEVIAVNAPAPVAPPPATDALAPLGYMQQNVKAMAPNAVAEYDAPFLRKDDRAMNTEEYGRIQENPFLLVRESPRSTFSVDTVANPAARA